MKRYSIIITFLSLVWLLASCEGDLDTTPLDKDTTTAANVYETVADFKGGLAKLYAGLATTGQKGPDGDGDIKGVDEGISSYVRQLFYLQEFPTEECKIAWNDQTVQDLNTNSWTSAEVNVRGMYYRISFEVALCNEFIRMASGNESSEVQEFVTEARFLRALAYYHALDMFGNYPFATEADPVGAYNPPMATRAELYAYVESELLAIADKITSVGSQEYGRASQGAVWTLLAKLYLNAEVYTGTAKWAETVMYCEKVIAAGYSLDSEYKNLFLADNNTTTGLIFPVVFDGQYTQTWGGTTFIIHAAVGGSMPASDFGINGGWAGARTTATFVDKFDSNDSRGMFYTDGQTKEVDNLQDFTNGYAVTKYKNLTSTGAQGSHIEHPDTDFPMFRLADVYLMYAEAVVRGGGGSATTALEYVNALRERAFGNEGGDITAGELNLDFLLEERARELYWEAQRRTDLVRFGKFDSSEYLWEWKGGTQAGVGFDSKYNIFPIPSSDIGANPNLKQNPGY